MSTDLDISVLLATHNRSALLAETLEAFSRLNTQRLTVEYVVIDNNSRDDTKDVVRAFADRLPLRYLFEPRPGKNCALNHALDRAALGAIVVFTDDDVSPNADWLTAIASTTARWPDISVFGGRIEIVWPDTAIPDWAKNPAIQGFAFGAHDGPGREGLYRPDRFPFGGNLWVRRAVVEGGRRFDEAVGPRPTNRIMGSETTFLRRLARDGYAMVYAPEAVVGHRIQPAMLSTRALWRRAFRQGRGVAHWRGLTDPQLLARRRGAWYGVNLYRVLKLAMRCLWLMMLSGRPASVEKTVNIIVQLGRRVESLRLAGRVGEGRRTPGSLP